MTQVSLKPIYILNGPNLNLLGEREPEVYGHTRLEDIKTQLVSRAKSHNLEIIFRQSNHAGELIEWIHEARLQASALILNPAAFGHTSVALHDALKTLRIPIIECHLSNPMARESFRHHSYVSALATGIISGFGAKSYDLALEAIIQMHEPC